MGPQIVTEAKCQILDQQALGEDSIYLQGDGLEGLGCGPDRTLEPTVSTHMQTLSACILNGATETHSSWALSLWWTGPGQEYIAVCVWQERSGPAHSTLQLGAGSAADRSWERLATEAAQVPGGSTTT